MEMAMEKLADPTIRDYWIIYLFHFHFLFPHRILDPNTALNISAFQLKHEGDWQFQYVEAKLCLSKVGLAHNFKSKSYKRTNTSNGASQTSRFNCKQKNQVQNNVNRVQS